MNPFKHTNTKGQSMLEIAITLPFFLMIIFGIIEYSNMFMLGLRASNLSREVANTTFRDCAYLNDSQITSCLGSNVDRVWNEGNLLLTDFANRGTVVASTYAPDANPGSVRLVGQQLSGSDSYESRYDATNIDPDVVNNHERVVIGEVFYPYTPITPISGLLTLLNIRTVIYEVTIF